MAALDRHKHDDEDRHRGTDYDDSGRIGPDDSGASPPYDSGDLDKVPRPTTDDPPYRSWWVI
jgi:hypothetical protein